MTDDVRARELAHHEELYSGFAQQHFAKAAVRALRAAMVRRILKLTRASRDSRVLSLGCGIADTEILLAPHVAHITGIDLSPSAIRQAREDVRRLNIANLDVIEGTIQDAPLEGREFDAIIAIFFLHHLPGDELKRTAAWIFRHLRPGGVFYSLDPSCFRLSGAIGRIIVPRLMKRYQTPDEHELDPRETSEVFTRAGFESRYDYFDFASSPLAGLFPSWRGGYLASRAIDNLIVRTPLLRKLGSNFEIVARKPD